MRSATFQSFFLIITFVIGSAHLILAWLLLKEINFPQRLNALPVLGAKAKTADHSGFFISQQITASFVLVLSFSFVFRPVFSLSSSSFFFGFNFLHTSQHIRYYFPDQGSNSCPLDWEGWVLTTGTPGNSLFFLTFNLFISSFPSLFHLCVPRLSCLSVFCLCSFYGPLYIFFWVHIC